MLKILYLSMFSMLTQLPLGLGHRNADKTSSETTQSSCGIKIQKEVKHITNDAANGEIKLTISGGMAPYQIFWIGNVPSKYINSEKIEGLQKGFYSVVVVDKNRCSETLMNIKVDLNPDK